MPHATLTEADIAAVDQGGMAGHIADWPGQVARQRTRLGAAGWPRLAPPRLLAVGGMGGSAIAADVVFGLAGPRLPWPTLVCRDYRWPAAVGPGAVTLLSSYSGNTEESLELYEEAGRRGAARVALTTGGELGRRAERDGVPQVALPPGLPPRAALGYSIVSLSLLLEALGDPGEGEAAWDEAVAVLAAATPALAPASPEAANPAKQMARLLAGRAICAFGGPGFPAACARRLANQVQENAKSLAFAGALPEMNHNEVVGFGALADLHPRFAAVFLGDGADDPRIVRRAEVTRALLEEEGVVTCGIASRGAGALARCVSLLQFADWLSFYLAVLAGVDPTPIVKIDRLKAALAHGGAPPAAAGNPGRTSR